MKDFGRWFAEFRLQEPPLVEFPESIGMRNGEWIAYCCVCDEPGPLFGDISEIPPTGYRHYCGRGPSCCP